MDDTLSCPKFALVTLLEARFPNQGWLKALWKSVRNCKRTLSLMSLRRENGGVEPHVIGRIELLAAGYLRISVPLAVVKVGGLRHQVGRVGESEGVSRMRGILRVQVPSPGDGVQQQARGSAVSPSLSELNS